MTPLRGKRYGFVPIAAAAWLAVGAVGCGEDRPTQPPIGGSADSVIARAQAIERQRAELDRTVWSREIEALRHEAFTFELWDKINAAETKLLALAGAALDRIELPVVHQTKALGDGLTVTTYEPAGSPREDPPGVLDREGWKREVAGLISAGWQLEMAEFHHEDFAPAAEGRGARSQFALKLYARHAGEKRRVTVEAEADVEWASPSLAEAGQASGDTVNDAGTMHRLTPTPSMVRVRSARVIERTGDPWFAKVAEIDPTAHLGKATGVSPLLVYDLDGDGVVEVIAAGANAVYRREASGPITVEPLMKSAVEVRQTGVLADVTGDGRADLIVESIDGQVVLYRADEKGRFSTEPKEILSGTRNVMAMSAADIDGDNDLDLWLGQYMPPYYHGQMPTPFYDANDGFPSFLLRNEGDGRFSDITGSAIGGYRRDRRVYSGSLADVDGDGDADLFVVSDFAGVDLYLNDGTGRFEDATEGFADRHNFGMAHTFADFDLDGRSDVLVIGMSSAVPLRLDAMGLARAEFPRYTEMRAPMAFGNKLYLGTAEGRFVPAPVMKQTAATGWSWGVGSLDFDNDGDMDAAVANGHISGPSVEDYCSTFWRHDMYLSSAAPDDAADRVMSRDQRNLGADDGERRGRSWDGYQKNALLMNLAGEGFLNVGYPMGVGEEFDGRSLVAADLESDGRVDLLVVENPSHLTGGDGQVLHIYRNVGPAARHWIGVRLREHGGGFSPLGAKVTVKSGDATFVRLVVTGDSFRAQHPPIVHFGLGERERVESVEVRWPNGNVSRLEMPETNRYHDVGPPSP